MSFKRRPQYRPATFATRNLMVNRLVTAARMNRNRAVGSARAASAIIAASPALRGYARVGTAYTGKYGYGSRSGEVKFLDTTTSFAVDTTGEVPATGQLNLIPQGVEESQRVGRKVTIKSIHVRWVVNMAATATSPTIRILLVQDTQCNGAAATYSGVNGVLETDTVQAFRNLENSQRFIIHKDWFFPLNTGAGVTGSFNPFSKTIKWSKTCSIPIEFDSSATTGAIGTIRSNNLFLIARANVDDDLVAVNGVVRIRYTDN